MVLIQVYDEEENSVSFAVSAVQNTSGSNELVIHAVVPQATATPTAGDQPTTGTKYTWSIAQPLIQEIAAAGFSTVKVSVQSVSVIIPVEELSAFTREAFLITVEAVNTETLPASVQGAMGGMTIQTAPHKFFVQNKAADEMILVSFDLPEGALPEDYQIVSINGEVIGYPEATLSVSGGISSLQANVLNGSICFLAMK